MRAEEIRNTFLSFFAEKGHKIVPSAPIVVKNDPTLLFTNAGMNQFKDYFLGNKPALEKRIADTQKCLRVSGKHNDLEEVGIDTYHHTMFEMLGNWSFGDYFKVEALNWAWELLVDRLKLDPSRLYVTIFEGDESENLLEDIESYEIWKTMVPEDQILRGNKKDNFWEMGDTGPCGPCSEIHFDNRSDEERALIPGQSLVNKDDPQVIEIWNNVFMQFNRKSDGTLEYLPAMHVDTGMGFERLVRVMQGKHSNYDTDVFQPIISRLAADFGKTYGQDEKTDIACRVIADHIRAVAFTIADGQLPSNTGAGYVIRRILRRAVRYGYTFLGMKEPYIYKLVDILAEQFVNIFPEINSQKDFIKKVIQEEEASFLRTLATGIGIFEKHVGGLEGKSLAGKFVFELYDTYGFPFDLTQLMAREKGLEVDEAGFKTELDAQKARSRDAAAKEEGDWQMAVNTGAPTEFIGYDSSETHTHIQRYRQVTEKGQTRWQLVLAKTPFYPEGGGQVGDTGTLQSANETLEVLDTYKENDLIIHVVDKQPMDPEQLFFAQVNTERRNAIAANHSATHLLHAALRQVLGTHVVQKGSLVNEKGLRFDFAHFAKMTEEEIEAVEQMVNARIRNNIPLKEERAISFHEAQERGAMALFGEKYGDKVRMITFDPQYSVELCGGIHASATGKLGYFKIISEGAVAAGVRRIEAVTGEEAERFIRDQSLLLRQLRDMLKNPKDLVAAVEGLRENNKSLQQEIEKLQMAQVVGIRDEIVQMAESLPGDLKLVAQVVPLDSADAGKNLVFDLKNVLGNAIILLGAASGDKANLWLSIPENITKEKGLNAGALIREIAKEIDGGGGGQAFFATAGGKKPSGLQAAIEKGRSIILEKVQ